LGSMKGRPLKLVVGYLEGATKRDAEEYARGFIERYFASPKASYWAVYRHQNGYLYELHEGGRGLSYVPRLLKAFSSTGENRVFHIATVDRVVRFGMDQGRLQCELLPEKTSVRPDNIKPAGRMRRYGMAAELAWGGSLVFAVFSSAFMAFAIMQYMALPVVAERVQAPAKVVLPLLQWNAGVLNVGDDHYVAALKFVNNAWSVDKRSRSAPPEPKQTQGGTAQPPAQPAPAAAQEAIPVATAAPAASGRATTGMVAPPPPPAGQTQ
ncbi:MAG: hypothetical protein K2Q10_11865, partial [Rhodospirillales bacterium]|nr:hypothetical protein [Rhodospirillales bacterium]